MPARINPMRIPMEGFLQGNQAILQGGMAKASAISQGFAQAGAGIRQGARILTSRKMEAGRLKEAKARRDQQGAQFAANLALQYRGQSLNAAAKAMQLKLDTGKQYQKDIETQQDALLEIAANPYTGVESEEYETGLAELNRLKGLQAGIPGDVASIDRVFQDAARLNVNLSTLGATGKPAFERDDCEGPT